MASIRASQDKRQLGGVCVYELIWTEIVGMANPLYYQHYGPILLGECLNGLFSFFKVRLN